MGVNTRLDEIKIGGFGLTNMRSVAMFDTYEQAQAAVDYLADVKFPVAGLTIVGADLRMIEKVVGRKTYGTVAWRGAMNGISSGVLLGILLGIFFQGLNLWNALMYGILAGMLFGILFSVIAYAVTGSKRDFDSFTRIVPTHFEVIAEAKLARKAKEILFEADQIARGIQPGTARKSATETEQFPHLKNTGQDSNLDKANTGQTEDFAQQKPTVTQNQNDTVTFSGFRPKRGRFHQEDHLEQGTASNPASDNFEETPRHRAEFDPRPPVDWPEKHNSDKQDS